ncbi:glycosyltransferase family 4 protein [Roseomonas elaeocarpi]|uniref:Glycosyltransferase family 4 protein n=1 Tax=Roseomonas elaeocarpi TaxID=907779 RepID=A0ABV6JSQ7_9PROT
MKILFVSNLYPPNVVGGYERLCFEVASAMAEAGHEVTVLTSSFGGKVADYPRQTVLRTLRLMVGENIYSPWTGTEADRDALNAGNVAALDAALDQARPDVIFAWNLFFLHPVFLGALEATGRPVVMMLTDNWLINMREGQWMGEFFRDHVFGDKPFDPAQPAEPAPVRPAPTGVKAWLRALLHPAPSPSHPPPVREPRHRLGASAIFGAEFMRDLHHAAGFRFRREVVVHNGVHQSPRPAAEYRDRTSTVQPGELRLLFAGRLVDLKGADTAVDALAQLDREALRRAGIERVRLTLLGDTQDENYLRLLNDRIAASPFAHEIERREPVAHDALFALFQDHDVYLFPSLYEPFSLTLIHALAEGIPTIASRAGGNTEIVRDNETGLLFRKGDAADLARAINRMGADGALRQRLMLRGQAVAAEFTFARMIGQMEEALRAPS